MGAQILVLTCADDPTAERVGASVAARGAHVVQMDPGDFPGSAEVAFSVDRTGAVRRHLRSAGQEVDLDGLTCVWHRRPSPPVPPAGVDQVGADYLAGEARMYLDGVWRGLSCRQVPAPRDVIDRADRKAYHLGEAVACGFAVPPTLITTDPDRLLDFYEEHDGRVISKAVQMGMRGTRDDPMGRYTERITHRDLGYAAALRLAPMILQAYVRKDVEIRVTVVGDAVFPVEIDSQATNHTAVDWRRYDLHHTPHRPHRLPGDVADRCRTLVHRLGLSYGCLDLILTPEGRYVFLELNPNGQFDWLEMATGVPITAALTDLLVTGAVGVAA